MIKIGIITFHRANNYGAVLQCYALQETLKHLGYIVQVIDYRQPFIELCYDPFRIDIIKQFVTRPRLVLGYLFKVLPERYKKARLYNSFRKKYLNCTHVIGTEEDMPQDINVFLIGSDQMWNQHLTGDKIDPIYFGEFKIPATSNIQGYAISSNIQSLQTIGVKQLSKYTKNFKRLSFREKTIRNEVEKLTGFKGEVVLDPTLLLNYKDWDKLTSRKIIKGKYILTYFLHKESSDIEFEKKVQQFAQHQNLRLVNIFDIAFSPVDFLNAIKYAEYILTTSFHAVVFSILFKKKFYAIKTNDGRDMRYIDLMKALEIDLLVDINLLPSLHPVSINYNKVDEIINKLRYKSIKYLKEL